MWIQSPAEPTGDGALRSLLFAETWMDLETIIQSEVRKRKPNSVKERIYVESRKIAWVNLFVKHR